MIRNNNKCDKLAPKTHEIPMKTNRVDSQNCHINNVKKRKYVLDETSDCTYVETSTKEKDQHMVSASVQIGMYKTEDAYVKKQSENKMCDPIQVTLPTYEGFEAHKTKYSNKPTNQSEKKMARLKTIRNHDKTNTQRIKTQNRNKQDLRMYVENNDRDPMKKTNIRMNEITRRRNTYDNNANRINIKKARQNQSKYTADIVPKPQQNSNNNLLRTYVAKEERTSKPKRKSEDEGLSPEPKKIRTNHHHAHIAYKHRKQRAKSKPTYDT